MIRNAGNAEHPTRVVVRRVLLEPGVEFARERDPVVLSGNLDVADGNKAALFEPVGHGLDEHEVKGFAEDIRRAGRG